MSYLVMLKTLNVMALQAVFDDQYPIDPLYPEKNFRNLHVSIEYPVDAMNYPGIWVDYSDAADLQIAGVDHTEPDWDEEGTRIGPYTRWKYSGYVSYTITALTSMERDRLVDELVKVFAFGRFDPERSRFRSTVESNPWIAANMNFDRMSMQGNSAAPGTPWGTDEIIYEKTIQIEIMGEFVSDNHSGEIVPLSEVKVQGTADATGGLTLPPTSGDYVPGEWI